jgi:cation transport protein ChaC
MSDGQAHWIFGYGSLMWKPGFPWSDRAPALLRGHQRAFCRYSFRHRGTPAAPGLVIGLREGGACKGIAYRPRSEQAALDYLDGREGTGYRRHLLPLELETPSGQRAGTGWVYVPNRDHPSYFGRQHPDRIARLVASGRGESGTALEYLVAMLAELERLGVDEPDLKDVLRRAQALPGVHTGG